MFSDATLRELQDADPETHADITANFAKWDAIDVSWKGDLIRTHGHAFAGLSRKVMLEILQDRCEALGVDQIYNRNFTDLAGLSDYDLVIAADGSNSLVRKSYEDVSGPRTRRLLESTSGLEPASALIPSSSSFVRLNSGCF